MRKKTKAPMPLKSRKGILQVVNRILDRGIVVSAKTRVFLYDLKLLEMEALILLASFETAGRLGIGLPKDVDAEASGWREQLLKENCPNCSKKISRAELFLGCPWCGYEIGG